MLSGFIFELIAKLFGEKQYTDREREIGKRREIAVYIFFFIIALLILITFLTVEK